MHLTENHRAKRNNFQRQVMVILCQCLFSYPATGFNRDTAKFTSDYFQSTWSIKANPFFSSYQLVDFTCQESFTAIEQNPNSYLQTAKTLKSPRPKSSPLKAVLSSLLMASMASSTRSM